MNVEHKRRQLRYYDYDSGGARCITLCTHGQQNTLAKVTENGCELTDCGEVVDGLIQRLSADGQVMLDRYVIMPNHVHLILAVTDEAVLRQMRESPKSGQAIIARAVGFVMMNTAKTVGGTVWQRGYLDHTIHGAAEYEKIADHVDENPTQWETDGLYTA